MLLAHIFGIPVEESLMPLASAASAGMVLAIAGMVRTVLGK